MWSNKLPLILPEIKNKLKTGAIILLFLAGPIAIGLGVNSVVKKQKQRCPPGTVETPAIEAVKQEAISFAKAMGISDPIPSCWPYKKDNGQEGWYCDVPEPKMRKSHILVCNTEACKLNETRSY